MNSLFKIINFRIDVDLPLFFYFIFTTNHITFFESLLYIKTYLQTIYNSYQQLNINTTSWKIIKTINIFAIINYMKH